MKIKNLFLVLTGLILLSSFSVLNALDVYGVLLIGEDTVLGEDLHVHPGGVVMNENYTVTLTVIGDVINEGSIQDNDPWDLYIKVRGDITNNGNWSCRNTYLDGTTVQHISGTSPFQSPDFYNDNPSTIIADSDLFFEGAEVRWQNNGSLDLSAGYDLNIDQNFLYQADIIGGNSSELNLSNNAYLNFVSASDVTLSGTTNIGSTVEFSGSIINNNILQNHTGYWYTLSINGNLTNNGTIQNHPSAWHLNINISGDIVNNGIWNGYNLQLTGAEQHITCTEGNTLSPTNFYGNTSRGNIYFDSDIEFVDTIIDLNDDNIILQTGNTLTINGGRMYDGIITANDAVLNMLNNAYIQDLDIIENVELQGTCQIGDAYVDMTGTVTVTGILQNYGYSYTLIINGDLINNGTIRNNPGSYYLHLDISGDIINNGAWTNRDIELIGTTDQHISCPSDSSFSVSYFYGNGSRGDVYFDSDIGFTGTVIDLNADNIILQSGTTLSLSGGYMFDGTLTGTTAAMDMSGDNYIYLLTINVTDLTLSGTGIIANNVIINGDVINNGYLQNLSNGTYILYLNGDLTNNGTVRNSPASYYFRLDISGNIINNSNWTNNYIKLTGAGQHISCGIGNTFDINNFYGNSSARGDVYFDSDIGFTGTVIDLNADNIILQSETTLSLSGGYMFDGTLTGTIAALDMSGGHYIYLLTFNVADLTLSGICQIANDIYMNGNVINNGYLQNHPSNFHIYLNGDFTNNGTIRNNPSGYYLYAHLYQDVTNNGSWTNYRSYINGTVDQTITINSGNEITGDVRFDSDIVVSPYQWRFDDSNLDSPDFAGETGSQLDWNVPVASSWFGTFDCVTGGGTSRDIIVVESGAAPDTPQNLTIAIVGSNVVLDWDDVTGASSYSVYSDSDPYGSFIPPAEYTGAASTCTISIPGDKKFYRVTASN